MLTILLFLTIYSLEIFILLYVLCIICNKWQLCFFWSDFYSIYLPCFIQLAQTFNVILNRNSNRKYLCLFQILKWRILITYYWISCLCMKECWIIEHERLWEAYIKMIYTFQLGILHLCSLANLNFFLMIFSLVILVLEFCRLILKNKWQGENISVFFCLLIYWNYFFSTGSHNGMWFINQFSFSAWHTARLSFSASTVMWGHWLPSSQWTVVYIVKANEILYVKVLHHNEYLHLIHLKKLSSFFSGGQ